MNPSSGATTGVFLRADFWLPAICIATALVAGLPFLWLIGDMTWRGAGELSWLYWSTSPTDAGRAGGILPIILSTLWVLGVTICSALPVAMLTAMALTHPELSQRTLCRFARRALDVLAMVPSIVFGLFGNALFCVALGLGYSILAGGLTLACMILPMLTRLIEHALLRVPESYQQAAASLGLSSWRTYRNIILPAALPGIGSALLLSLGRALAETAALVYTSGYAIRTPHSVLVSGRTLSVHIYDLAMNVAGGESRAYAASITLMLLFVGINFLAWIRIGAMHRSLAKLSGGDR